MFAEQDVVSLKDAMRVLADPGSNCTAEERVEQVIAILESLQLSSYTPATFPLSDADACDIIGNAAVAICQLGVGLLEDMFKSLQARVAGSGELLRTVLHRGMGHPGTASLYPSGAKWMSERMAGWVNASVPGWVGARGFDDGLQEVDPSRCCGMLCAQMLSMLGACHQFRRAGTLEAVRREMPTAAVEWMLGAGTEWQWAYPMRFIQELCDPRGNAPEEDGSREGFIAMLLSMPAVEEACDAAAAAVKPLLDSARKCSEALWCPPSLPQQTF